MRNASRGSKQPVRTVFLARIYCERCSGKRKRGLFANLLGSAKSRSPSRPAQIRFQRFAQATLEADQPTEQESPQPGRGISPRQNRQILPELCATPRRDFSAFDSEDGSGTRRLAKEIGRNSEEIEESQNRSGETQATPPDRTAAGIPAG